MESNGKALWFVAGAAVGATLALLYAPQPGTETRRAIRDKTREGGQSFAESGRDLIEKGRELYEKGLEVAEEAADMIERGRRLVEE